MKKGIRKHFFNEDYFEKIDTEDKAYWLGFISADGSIVKSSKYNSFRLYINLNVNDEDHLKKFLKQIEANDIEIQHCTNTSGFGGETHTSRIIINSFKMCSDLEKYNIHIRKTYDIELPKINDELIRHYLRGFFDGDGSYYYKYDDKNKRFRYSFEVTSASLKVIEQMQHHLLLNNIKLNIYKRYPKNENYVVLYRLMTGGKNNMLKLINYIYKNASVYLERKYNKINEIKSIAV